MGIKIKTNMTIVSFFSLSSTAKTALANVMVSLKSVNKLPRVFSAAEKWMVRSTAVGGLISL